MPDVLTLAEAAEYLSVTTRWLGEKVRAGEIRCAKIQGPSGGTAMLRFRKEWLDEFLESQAGEEAP